MELALGDGAVAEEAGGDALAALQPVGEGEPDRDREAAADDRVAAVEAARDVEEVHRAAAPAAAAGRLAEHLRHQRRRRAARGRAPARARGRSRRSRRPGVSACIDADARPPPPRCRGGGSRGSWRGCRARPPAPRSAGCGASRAAAARACSRVERRCRGPGCRFRARRVGLSPAALTRALSSVETSPSGRPSSRAFSRRRMILPLRVVGTVVDELDLLRGDDGAEPHARVGEQLLLELARGLVARLQRHERLHDLAGDRVGLADHARPARPPDARAGRSRPRTARSGGPSS